MMKLICKNSEKVKTINYFGKKALYIYIFDRILDASEHFKSSIYCLLSNFIFREFIKVTRWNYKQH